MDLFSLLKLLVAQMVLLLWTSDFWGGNDIDCRVLERDGAYLLHD
jgi:hypothetical protein